MPPLQESFQGQDAKEAYLKQTVSIVNNTKYIYETKNNTKYVYETIVEQQFVTVWGNKTIPGSELATSSAISSQHLIIAHPRMHPLIINAIPIKKTVQKQVSNTILWKVRHTQDYGDL